tara:strand:+ start:288 stop:473 length:186 start_codon:yes stop_codon:yes gene_type:complete
MMIGRINKLCWHVFLSEILINNKKSNMNNKKICLVGLGYVGRPLAVAFVEKFQVIGFNVSP